MQHLFSLSRLFIALVLIAASIIGAGVFIAHNSCIDFSVLENYRAGTPSIVLDDQGVEWTRFQLDRREPIKLEVLPKHLIDAFIAAEDWAFFKHSGISLKGIIRSTVVNLYHGRIVQGASTITQQLVRLLFFDSQRTFKRKIKEQILSLVVERQCTKEQILETYLNHVYFGCGIYGVEAASQRFWGKHACELTIDQSAVLAAIMRSPARYCPLLCPLSCQKRRNVILGTMARLGFITKDECVVGQQAPLNVRTAQEKTLAPHAREAVRLMLEEQLGKITLYTAGLTIQTTINQNAQAAAEKYFKEQIVALRGLFALQVDGGLLTIETKTGAIKALVGGHDFEQSKFNRALQAKRQIGSTFKPLVYAVALQAGMNFADTAIDEPIEIVQGTTVWRPRNVYREFNNQMTLAYACSHSNNIVAIKTFLAVGAERVIDLAKKCRLPGPLHPYPSLALGCTDATLKEVTGMFNIFANDGNYVEPHLIKWVKDRWGNKLYKAAPEQEQVMQPRISGQVAKVLELGLERVRKFFPDQPWVTTQTISKTGTTNDSRSCWYIGSTPDYTTGVYIGCDDNRPMGKEVYPLNTAFPIWIALNRVLPVHQAKFSYDPSLTEVLIHGKTGLPLGDPTAPEAIAIFI